MWNKIKPYVISVLIALGVGALSALITRGSMNIYDRIVMPPLAPPGFLFPIVWTVLYTLMGISSARIYLKGREEGALVGDNLKVYALQLVVNFFWSIIFFDLQAVQFAFWWLILLWILIIIMIALYLRCDKLAAWLQIPYFLWVTFAGYLTYMAWMMN